MIKSLTIGSILAATGALATGTFAGLYIHERVKNEDKSTNWYMQQIVSKINGIPGVDNILTVEEFEEDIKTRLSGVSNEHKSMQDATIEILKEKIKESHDNVMTSLKQAGDVGSVRHNLLATEITAMQDNLHKELTGIKGGMVGKHDLNYYKEVLDASVRTSQFDDLVTELGDFETKTHGSIDGLVKDMGDNRKNITSIKEGLTALTDTSSAALGDLSSKLDGVKSTLDQVITETGNGFSSLTNEIDQTTSELKRMIAGVDADASTNTDAILGLDDQLREINIKMDNNSLTIAELGASYNSVIEAKAKIDLKVQSLISVIDRVNSTAERYSTVTDASIESLKTSTTAFETKFKEVNTSLTNISVNYLNLKARVTKNEDEISALWNKMKNTTTDVNTKLQEIDKHMIGFDESITGIWDKHDKFEVDFRQSIVLHDGVIATLTDKITELKSEVATATENIAKIQEELAVYAQGVQAVRDSISSVLSTIDLLSAKVDNNTADIYHLKDRIEMLENRGSTTSEQLYLYHKPDGAGGKYLYHKFYSPTSFSKFRKLQIEYYDGHAKRISSMDVPIFANGTGIKYFNTGDRLHPNRSWFALKIDYRDSSIQMSYYFTAGNASWSWHSNTWAIVAKSIRGIYK